MMTLQRTIRSAAGLAALLAAAAAQAHPGHGLTAPDNLMHVLEADHVVPMLLALAVGYAVVLVRSIRRRRRSDRAERADRASTPTRR